MALNLGSYNFDQPGELERYMRDQMAQQQAAQAAPKGLTAADIINGSGYAANPAAGGALQQAYARLGLDSNGNTGDWTDFSFDPTGRQSLAGWAPGSYKDNSNDFLSRVGNAATNIVTNPAAQFFAATGGQGGMTLANAATGGNVGQGVTTDLAGLAGGYAAAQALPALGLSVPAATAEEAFLSGGAPAAAGAGGATAPAAPEAAAANVAGGLKVAPEAATLESAIGGASTAGGASGITPGTVTAADSVGGLGSGLTVPGVTGAGTTGALGAAGIGLGAGALGADALGGAAAGGTASTVATPAAAGAAGAGAGAGTAAAAGAGGVGATKLSDVLNGNVNPLDNLTLGNLGTIGATAGSIAADTHQADQLKAMYNQYLGLGAPSRARYEDSFSPNFDINSIPGLQGAMDTSYQGLLRGLSTQGNPYGSPGALAEAQKYIMGNVALPTLQQYRNQQAATGGFGAFSAAAPGVGGSAISAGSNVASDLGRGVSNIFNPPTTMEQFFNQMKSGSGVRSLT